MIKVKHAPSAAAIGESAYTIGRGERRERDIHFAAEVGLRQASLSLQARGQDIQAKRGRQQFALQEEELGFRKQQWEDEPARQLEKSLQQQELLRKNLRWQYSEAQKREMAHVIEGIGWLRARDDWTPEQKEDAERQLWQKYYKITPLQFYDDNATPEEIRKSRTVTLSNGAQLLMDSKGDFKEMPGSISFQEFNRARADAAKAYTTIDDITDKPVVDTEKANAFVEESMYLFSKIQELPSRAEAIQKSRADRLKKLSEDEEQEAITEQAEMDMAVASLPRQFEEEIEGPKIGRIGGGKPRWTKDDVYGEEAYNKLFIKVSETNPDIPQDVIKAELDKWWLAKFEEDKGKTFQRYQNPMEFKGAAQEAEKVKMKAPDGKIYEVDRSEAEEAEKHGWVIF